MSLHSISTESIINELKKDINLNIHNQHISITNTEAIYLADKDQEHFNYINNARFSLCDGVGIKISGL